MILYDIRNALQMTDKDFGHLFGCSEQKAALYMNYRDDLPKVLERPLYTIFTPTAKC